MDDNGGQKSEECESLTMYMFGYLPGASPERSLIMSPAPVRIRGGDHSWTDACGGGCGFAMAISGSGKLITWGSVEDEGQSYLTSGKHGEIPEAYPLPTEASVVKAAAGWAHCVAVTGSLRSQGSNLMSGAVSNLDNKKDGGEEFVKRRKMASVKQESDSAISGDELFTVSPCLVTLGSGVRITKVAAGGRHTLALSDMGQVWGWGYGGEGQLGLGSRVKMVTTPQVIPCIEPPGSAKVSQDSKVALAQASKAPGSFVKEIACGGRHSIVMTDAGEILTFGWGLYGQCGQGVTYDQLRPTYVNSFSGVRIEKVAAGLWHTLCVSAEGRVYAFGGNQFGQLGTGADQAETLPRLLDSPSLEGKNANLLSCGARHSAIATEEGQVFSWGWNKYGQLGLGDSVDRNTPSQVSIIGVPKNVVCGWWHTLLLAETAK